MIFTPNSQSPSNFFSRHTGLFFVFLGFSFFFIHTVNAQTLPRTLKITAGDYTEELSSPDFSSWFQLDTKVIMGQTLSEATDTRYCPTEFLYCDISLSRYTRARFTLVLDTKIEREHIENFIIDLASRINQSPSDAVFGVSDSNQVIVAQKEKLGRKLNTIASVDLILRAFTKTDSSPLKIALPIEITAPTIVGSDRERLGLKELIGEGKTNFKGSPKNRIFNIKRSLQQFQNVLIAPGEEFSFVKYLGEVDGEHGYLPELVIKNNQTTPEFGGGICQVSSTVFRAAIYSGLKLTERRNHAYPVQYYKPYGMDATVYIPKPDLSFINNTPGSILIHSTIEGDDLIFHFFGTKDGRTVSIDGPHILERGGDGSMKTVFTQEVNDAQGKNFIRDSFWSNYKSPSLFPHSGAEPVYTEKPKDWSEKQWKAYKATRP